MASCCCAAGKKKKNKQKKLLDDGALSYPVTVFNKLFLCLCLPSRAQNTSESCFIKIRGVNLRTDEREY